MNRALQPETHPGRHPDAESLNAFLEQALPAPERAQILGHIASCSRCRQVVFLAQQAAAEAPEVRVKPRPEDLPRLLEDPDWKQRYAALEATGADPACLPHLVTAMQDAQVAVRRLATVLVGLVGTPETLGPLCRALQDPAVAVRRSAGDALNDLGDPAALPALEAALADPNKLVRWRAARFLFEQGGRDNLPALARAQDDPEFEVRMQVRQAMERIEGGQAAQGPVWMRMTQKRPG